MSGHDDLIGAYLKRIREQTPPEDKSVVAGVQDERALQEKLKSDRLKAELVDFQQNIAARKQHANRAFWLVVLWLGWMMIIVVLQGFLGHGKRETSYQVLGFSHTISEPSQFSLSDTVLIALISGATVSIFGFFAAVMNYLFPKSKI